MALPTEHAEQVSLCGWLAINHTELDYFAIPNGGERNVIVAQKLKAEGVKAGVPDLFFPSIRLFIEMKRVKGGQVSPQQKHWHDRLTKAGYTVAVCKGAAEAVQVITQHLGDNQHE
jgi:hypothetical protein